MLNTFVSKQMKKIKFSSISEYVFSKCNSYPQFFTFSGTKIYIFPRKYLYLLTLMSADHKAIKYMYIISTNQDLRIFAKIAHSWWFANVSLIIFLTVLQNILWNKDLNIQIWQLLRKSEGAGNPSEDWCTHVSRAWRGTPVPTPPNPSVRARRLPTRQPH